jgi:hypothetical protein
MPKAPETCTGETINSSAISRRQFGQMLASSATACALPACVSTGFQSGGPVMFDSGDESTRTLEVEGDPAVGTIYSIRQYHRDAMNDATQLPSDVLDCVFNYQLRILKELTRLQVDHVFMEGETRPFYFDAQMLMEMVEADVLDKTRFEKLDEGGRQKMLMDFKKTVYKYGGAFYYLDVNPKVKFHGVMSFSESAEVNGFFDRYKKNSDDPKLKDEFKAYQKRREEWAVREIMRFLAENRGEIVALIFGANHQFCDKLIQYPKKPRLITVDFPDFIKNAGSMCDFSRYGTKPEDTTKRQCSR